MMMMMIVLYMMILRVWKSLYDVRMMVKHVMMMMIDE